MKLSIHGHQVSLTPAIRQFVHKRLESTLKRFDKQRSGHITVILKDDNGQVKKGIDKSCQIQLNTQQKPLIIHEKGDNLFKMIVRACDRLQQVLIRTQKKVLQQQTQHLSVRHLQ